MTTAFINYVLDQGWEMKNIPTDQQTTQANDIILFGKNGLNFVFTYNKNNDSNYFEIILPYIDDFNRSNQEQFELLLSLNKDYKTGKVIIDKENHITLSFEQYVFSDLNINKLFEQAVGCLESMIREYRRIMHIIKSNSN
ncbi:MAG: hypothetical protein J6J29_06745 [Paludibacteraceae bacterium]|nr:hypothetical protein [Paludibacteraceae bacterium]